MAHILHIDTSGDKGLIFISDKGAVTAHRESDTARNYASVVNILIDDVIKEAAITLQDLMAVSVCAGPGSYTGLRIGLATAKGICYVLGIPLMLDNKLELIAYQEYMNVDRKDKRIKIFFTARENEYFFAEYDKDFNCIILPTHISVSNDNQIFVSEQPTLLIADDESIMDKLQATSDEVKIVKHIKLQAWARFADKKFSDHRFDDLHLSEPFYLKQVFIHK